MRASSARSSDRPGVLVPGTCLALSPRGRARISRDRGHEDLSAPHSRPARLPRDRRASRRGGEGDPRHRARVRARADRARSRRLVRAGLLPPRGADELAGLGLFGMHLDGYGLPGAQRGRVRPGVPGARGRRRRHAQRGLRPGVAGDVRDLALGLGGAEGAVAPTHALGRADRLLRADRVRRGLRSRARCGRMRAATATTGS